MRSKTLLGIVSFVVVATIAAAAVSGGFFQGFETDTDGWFGVTRVASGTNGITSADGGFHAEAPANAFTRYGGYTTTFPANGYSTLLDIYLDMDGGFANDTRFDFTSAISTPAGGHRRDFILTGGFYQAGTGPLYGSGNRFIFSASNNAPGWPANPGRDPVAVDTSGWYTIRHDFYDDGSGVLAVDISLIDPDGTTVNTWTLSDSSDVIGVTVGGNRYGWFATNYLPFLAIDNTRLVVHPLDNIVIDGCDTGVADQYLPGGTLMSEALAACADAKNHGAYVKCVSQMTKDWEDAGLLTNTERAAIVTCAAQSSLP
jgi:hypothetical protein